jgi:predicted nucleotidyltransferase component of viral defense system
LLIETFADNVASKMNALVQRGAPRDFTDIWQLVTTGHLTPTQCWELWSRKNPDLNSDDAQAEAGRHLHEIELRRPLDTLTNPLQREQARQTRDWFRTVFLQRSQA